jgi:hypothetical protein
MILLAICCPAAVPWLKKSHGTAGQQKEKNENLALFLGLDF